MALDVIEALLFSDSELTKITNTEHIERVWLNE
jgi:hypothetical protein